MWPKYLGLFLSLQSFELLGRKPAYDVKRRIAILLQVFGGPIPHFGVFHWGQLSRTAPNF